MIFMILASQCYAALVQTQQLFGNITSDENLTTAIWHVLVALFVHFLSLTDIYLNVDGFAYSFL